MLLLQGDKLMCVCYVYECMLGWGGAVDISAAAQCSNVQLQSPTFLSRMHRAVLGGGGGGGGV